ncbi:response regulator [Methanoregula sp.]|uniref:response regulator n=1 Tax=Methanoregula sp. TaxID=2052170 RepID=UPI002CB7CD93|nr:response regulator [Methanoregula sp.]HVP96280.1 response regulator [Methanoregula sp.]
MAQTISLLCIDDEPLFLDAFKARLEQEKDLAITTTMSAADALDLLNRQYFDVIVSDYSMPDMDGLVLLKEIRARGGQSIFVMATAKRLAHIARDALNSGADYYLQKGADMAGEVARLVDFIRVRVPQKNAEYELIAWARFYNSIVDSGADLVARIKADGSFTFGNERCVHLYKKPYRQLVKENYFAFIPDSERGEILSRLQALTPEKPDCLLQHRVIAGDGRSVLLEWAYHGFFSPAGAIQEYQVGGRDTSGLIRIGAGAPTAAEEAGAAATDGEHVSAPAEKAEEWSDLMATLQSLDAPVFAIDTKGVIIAWSAKLAQLTGVPAAEMIGKGGQEYAVPFYGKPGPMLIDNVIRAPGSRTDRIIPPAQKVGDTYIGEKEHVAIRGRPMILQAKCSPLQDATGQVIAAIEAITVSEEEAQAPGGARTEEYLGGISSLTLKTATEGVSGAIAGAIGSAMGGFGIYATSRRLFIIRNPDLDVSGPQGGVQFGTFIMDELFGTSSDTSQKTLGELESLRVFEADREDLAKIVLKKPVLLSGYLDIRKTDGTSFRMYIDHKKAYTYIENLLKMFAPDILSFE